MYFHPAIAEQMAVHRRQQIDMVYIRQAQAFPTQPLRVTSGLRRVASSLAAQFTRLIPNPAHSG
jgi:hypothetical protein